MFSPFSAFSVSCLSSWRSYSNEIASGLSPSFSAMNWLKSLSSPSSSELQFTNFKTSSNEWNGIIIFNYDSVLLFYSQYFSIVTTLTTFLESSPLLLCEYFCLDTKTSSIRIFVSSCCSTTLICCFWRSGDFSATGCSSSAGPDWAPSFSLSSGTFGPPCTSSAVKITVAALFRKSNSPVT